MYPAAGISEVRKFETPESILEGVSVEKARLAGKEDGQDFIGVGPGEGWGGSKRGYVFELGHRGLGALLPPPRLRAFMCARHAIARA